MVRSIICILHCFSVVPYLTKGCKIVHHIYFFFKIYSFHVKVERFTVNYEAKIRPHAVRPKAEIACLSTFGYMSIQYIWR